jgi:hypothetical protein
VRRGITFRDEVTVITYHDLVRAAGGKERLRRAGTSIVRLVRPAGEQMVEVQIIERAAWRGGSRSYIACPSCGAVVLQLLFDPAGEALRCARCWGPTRLRYRSQERRVRVSAPAAPTAPA